MSGMLQLNIPQNTHTHTYTCAHSHMSTDTHIYRPRVYLGQTSTVPRPFALSPLDCALTSSGRTVKQGCQTAPQNFWFHMSGWDLRLAAPKGRRCSWLTLMSGKNSPHRATLWSFSHSLLTLPEDMRVNLPCGEEQQTSVHFPLPCGDRGLKYDGLWVWPPSVPGL